MSPVNFVSHKNRQFNAENCQKSKSTKEGAQNKKIANRPNLEEDFFQILCPSQKVQTLIRLANVVQNQAQISKLA